MLLDLSKASDCVDREILLDKLKCYSKRGKVFELLESYLTKRKQFVGFVSTCENIDVEVFSYGTILSFTYINDLQTNTNFVCT